MTPMDSKLDKGLYVCRDSQLNTILSWYFNTWQLSFGEAFAAHISISCDYTAAYLPKLLANICFLTSFGAETAAFLFLFCNNQQ
jgi:hypothetical protein